MTNRKRNARRVRSCATLLTLWMVLIASGRSVAAADGEARGDAGKVDLEYYLSGGVSYDPAVPKPAEVLGWEVGQWHVRHDQLVRYFEVLAEASPRMRLETIGQTHENRPLLLATLTAPSNLGRIEEIRARHLEALRSGDAENTEGPVVVWMGYSIHGNESSGSNAALLFAYHLAAARGEAIERQLRDLVILIDPCLNPDGLSRFAQWANMHRGKQLVGDPRSREHREGWPSGRTNHYWFDLNRDWLLLTHPESRARVKMFHHWRPNIVTDFHEMGSDRTYFFQPGVPSRTHPLTPPANQELTAAIAAYHAEALDAIGSLYYSEEGFDDFYYGKGSTYPDVNGAVGILFEQASSRGHKMRTASGALTFPFTIRNQLTTSLSTLRAAVDLGPRLLRHHRTFHRDALEAAGKDATRAYVVQHARDPARSFHFADILRRHGIAVHELEAMVQFADRSYGPEDSWIVPLRQRQYRLAKALFERRTEFRDETFYDVSTWNLPLAFGLPFAPLDVETLDEALVGERVTPRFPRGELRGGAGRPYAFALPWRHYYAPRALQSLLQAGFRVRVATKPFTAFVGEDRRDFEIGALIVPVGVQDEKLADLRKLLQKITRRDGVDVFALQTGLTPEGIDLGSPSVLPVEPVRPLLVVGPGVRAYDAGALWHLLDTRYGVPLTLMTRRDFEGADLDEYTHVFLVSGSYSGLDDATVERLARWIRGGGILVAQGSGATWAQSELLGRQGSGVVAATADPSKKSVEPAAAAKAEARPRRYVDYDAERARNLLSGAIFAARIDATHPIGYGFDGDASRTVAFFRTSTRRLADEPDPLRVVARYTEEPLLSGYASEANRRRLAGTPAVCANRLGRGCVVRIADNVSFRGVWYGTSKLIANALYFGQVVRNTAPLGE